MNGAFDGEDDAASNTAPKTALSGAAPSADADRFSKPLRIETSHDETLDSGFGGASSGSINAASNGVITPGAVLDSGASSPASSLGIPDAGVGGVAKTKKKKLKSGASGSGSANSVASAASASSNASKGKSGAAGRTRKCGATGGLCTIYCTPLQCSAGPITDKKKTPL